MLPVTGHTMPVELNQLHLPTTPFSLSEQYHNVQSDIVNGHLLITYIKLYVIRNQFMIMFLDVEFTTMTFHRQKYTNHEYERSSN